MNKTSTQILLVFMASMAAASVLSALAVLPEMIKMLSGLGYGSGALIRATLWKMLAATGSVSPLAAGLAFTWRGALFTAQNETLAWATIGRHPFALVGRQMPPLLAATVISTILVMQISPWAQSNLIGIIHQPSEELATGTVVRTDAETWVIKNRQEDDESGLMIRHKPDGRVLLLTSGGMNRKRVLNGVSLGEGSKEGKWTLMNFDRMDLPKPEELRLPLPSNSIPAWPNPPTGKEMRARYENVLSCLILGLTGLAAGLVWGRKGWALPLGLFVAASHRAILLALDSVTVVNLICLTFFLIITPLLWKPRMSK